ncbi:MAG: prenyl protease-like protein [Propionibacteriaceae bacterium]|nr:prenyl protease-like protein [Propionibacteriaceae bacterium]
MSTTVKRPEMPHPEGTEKATTGITAFIRRHAVPTYYGLAFAISWGGILLILGPDGLFSTGATMPLAGGAALLAGPSIAGVLLTCLVDGRSGLRRLLSRLRRWRVDARWYAVALLTGPLVMGATVFVLSLASPEFRPDITTADNKLSIVVTGIVVGLMVGFFEELGWTGFAQPRLRQRYGVVTTGLVIGLLWSAWHFPMFAGTTDPTGTLPAALVVAVLLFAWLPPYRVLMVWVYDRSESLLIAMLMHVPISVTAFVLASEATSATALVVPVLVWGAAFWLIVTVVAWANGGTLTQRPEAAAQEGGPV